LANVTRRGVGSSVTCGPDYVGVPKAASVRLSS